MKSELRCYPPSSSSYWSIEPLSLEIEQAANYPAQLTASVTCDWQRYHDDDDAANPLQRGAYIEYWEGSTCLFRGKVKRVARALADGKAALSITALDKLQVLNETFAVYNNSYVWSRQTPPLSLSNVTLLAGYDYGDGLRNVWWPEPAGSAWLSTSASNSTTLGQNMTNVSPASGARLKLAQMHGGLPPAGFISIGSEWIEYNGYAWDPADQYWYAHNIRRASLGTTAAAHSSGDTAYSRLSQRIDPRGRIKLEGNNGGTWELVQLAGHCAPQWESGGFAFAQDPAALGSGGATYTAVRATYTVFDEENAGALKLSDVLLDVLQADPATGGPGFGGAFTDSAVVSISITPDPVLTRVVVPKKTRALACIRGLLDEIGLARGTAADAVLLHYDPDTDVVEVKSVAQLATPQRTYYGESQRVEETGADGLHSATLVEYEHGTPFNLISSRRMWHTVVGLAGSGSPPGGAVPAAFQKIGATWYGPLGLAPIGTYNFSQEIVPGVSGAANILTDNDETTGLALMWDTLQAAGVHFYAWFPGGGATTPDAYYITKLLASFDLVGVAAGNSGGGAADIDFEFVVFDSFTGSTSTTAPTAGTAYPLSVKASVQYSAGDVNQQVSVEADIPYISGKAIGLRINGYLDAGDSTISGSGFRYGFALNDIAVHGVQVKHELVQLSGVYGSGDTSTVVAADAAGKLLDAHMGQHDCGELSIGPATREVARGMGWIALLQSLAQTRSRTYAISSRALEREGIAQAGETVEFSGGDALSGGEPFTGVIDTAAYTTIAGRRTLTLRAVDYASDLTGGPGVSCAQLPQPRSIQLRRAEELRKASAARQRFVALHE
jgi:hypothetical protein